MFNPGLWRVRRFSDVMPEIMHLQQEMNRLFSSAGQKTTQDYPAVNIWEKDGASIVTAELPGIDSEKMDITVSGDVLSIAGTALKENFDKGETYLRQERGIGNFKRNIQIPYQVEVKAVEAKYEKGILMVTLPRIKEDLPKKIKIK
ncbi:MAG: Spore protein SP21 [Deltaproteobacteria bacterium ADurb.Bin151]|jgi:HSP20 family protein|nr:Hsp20/alpha crystallin family protein [Smithella sp.]OQB57315.1 MAG: Spore protein SP21 [Deltaproteobacteria bacterium ADurb.Bin151]HNZ09825.1 Hsp20/alpha crystallin family protein [Smithellaceae bacterium]HOQ40530.1 Hsp20/alpha crystallin family protein [Smithellaceae bacterium]HPL65089.1 Hsp20/alpha crystallin family protein [Smithellaceae bacterium]